MQVCHCQSCLIFNPLCVARWVNFEVHHVDVTALLLSRQSAPSLAYIAGSLGTLIGADLLNLGIIQELGAPVASIGGAGRFDGIFMTGILAVLLS